jgi:hypothetical protein
MGFRAMKSLGLLAVAGLLACGTLAACVDTTPVTVAPSEAGTALVDASIDAPDSAGGACIACLNSSACGDDWATCESIPACANTFACAASCFSLGSLDQIEICGLPCAEQNGITAVGDNPTFQAVYALFTCTAGACAVPCIGGAPDAGATD